MTHNVIWRSSMLRSPFLSLAVSIVIILGPGPGQTAAAEKLKALIVDGQNNHKNWPDTTKMMKKYLEQTGLFTVDVATTAPKGTDPNFKPEFKKYNVVVSNYNGDAWPKETQAALVEFVKGGGGFACIHVADNAILEWTVYNGMIGLGDWGRRSARRG